MPAPLDELLSAFDDTRPLEEAETIPGPWYVDPRLCELERSSVFARTWQMVGRAEQVAQPGQFITAEVAGEPIVVVCGNDGVLRAFFNVCRHHAAAVMTECAGRAERLRCPYHGWTYGLDGQLKTTPEFEGVRAFDRSQNGLVPLAVDSWESFVFVHVDPDPPPLRTSLGERLVKEVSLLGLQGLRFAERREWTLACNWKVFVDNYLDGGYHVPFLHRGLSSVLSYSDYAIETFDRVCLQSSPIDATGAAHKDVLSARRGRALFYWVYPNLMLNVYEGYLDTNWVIPLGPDRMKVVFDFYFDDVSPENESKNRASIDVSVRVQDEDHAICESVQRGLNSRAYRAGRLSVRREAGENLFHKLLAADLRAGVARERSRRGLAMAK